MKRIVLVPSNQAAKMYLGGQYSEHIVMAMIANKISQEAQGWLDIVVRVIDAAPDTADSYHLEGLYRAQSDVLRYLRSTGARPDETLVINFHSDSGSQSHNGYYWGDPVSKRIGSSLAHGLATMMGITSTLDADYGSLGYAFWTCLAPSGYTPVLLELGSHQNKHDVDWLLNRQGDIAQCIMEGAAALLETALPPKAPVRTEFDQYFTLLNPDVVVNPDAAFYKYARNAYLLGDIANIGPALDNEKSGAAFGVVSYQKFANAILTWDGQAVRRAQVVLERDKWSEA